MSRKRSNPGFTLVELILALVVTSLAVTIVAQGFTTGGRGTAGSNRLTRAVLLAQMKLVEVETGELAINQGDEGVFPSPWEEYRYVVTTATGEHEGLYDVAVAVFWTERGRERSYTLERSFYRPE